MSSQRKYSRIPEGCTSIFNEDYENYLFIDKKTGTLYWDNQAVITADKFNQVAAKLLARVEALEKEVSDLRKKDSGGLPPSSP